MNKHGWTYKKLGDVCETSSGGTPSKNHKEYYDNGNIPWLRSGEVSQTYICETELFITQMGLDNSSAKIFPVDTVVIAMYGATVGQVGILKNAMCTNQAVCGVFPNCNFKPDFLMHFLKSKKAFFLKNAVGGAQSNISQTIIKDLRVPVPSMEEQEAIVAELDEINEAIAALQQQVADLDTLAQSTFYDMFGDPVTNEKGWEIKTIADLFDVGSSKRVFEAQWRTSGIPFYRAREIVRLSRKEPIQDMIYIDKSLYDEYSNKYGVPTKGDMMVTGVGTLGTCYLVENDEPFYFKDGNILWFRSLGLCDTRFIRDQFYTDFVKQQIMFNANAAVVGTYTITNAKKQE